MYVVEIQQTNGQSRLYKLLHIIGQGTATRQPKYSKPMVSLGHKSLHVIMYQQCSQANEIQQTNGESRSSVTSCHDAYRQCSRQMKSNKPMAISWS